MENIVNEKETVLEVRDLELWFNGDYGAVKILNKVSFDIHKGETLGIVGESGCGKSMTSLCIMQLLNSPPAVINGSIKLRGRELLALSDKQMQLIRFRREGKNILYSLADEHVKTILQMGLEHVLE